MLPKYCTERIGEIIESGESYIGGDWKALQTELKDLFFSEDEPKHKLPSLKHISTYRKWTSTQKPNHASCIRLATSPSSSSESISRRATHAEVTPFSPILFCDGMDFALIFRTSSFVTVIDSTIDSREALCRVEKLVMLRVIFW